jgi:CYTH domain-containing protein
MQLNEFFYNFVKKTSEQRYDNSEDRTVMVKTNSRKARLTLKEINKLRQMKEIKAIETKKQQEFIALMYAQPVESTPSL